MLTEQQPTMKLIKWKLCQVSNFDVQAAFKWKKSALNEQHDVIHTNIGYIRMSYGNNPFKHMC